MSTAEVHAEGLLGWSSPEWPGVRAVFAGRKPVTGAGNLSLSGGRDAPSALAARAVWSRHLGVRAEDWVCGALEHGNRVRVVGEAERGRGALAPEDVLPSCDGLVTASPGLPLYLPVADCAAVLLWRDGPQPRLGVLHAGWRGLVAGILEQGVQRMSEGGGSRAEIRAWISPCARFASYEVGPEVAERAPPAAVRSEGKRWRVDIGRWCVEALSAAGLPRGEITDCTLDTIADARLFSHRREGASGGRNGLLAILAPPAGGSRT